MKRIFSTLCLVALVALVATSCKKKTDEGASFNVSLEPIKGYVAGESFDGSKAYIDPSDWTMRWNDGDEIMVYNLNAEDYTQSVCHRFQAYPNSEGKTKTGFGGTAVGPKMSGGYFYFYHANKAAGNIQQDNRETFTVAKTQYCDKPFYGTTYFCDPTAIVMACPVNAIANTDFIMQHIFGFMNIGIAGAYAGYQENPKWIKSIELHDDSWNLNGSLSLKLLAVDPSKFSTAMGYLESGNSQYQTYLSQYLNELGYHAQGNDKVIIFDCSQVNNGQGVEIKWHEWKNFFIPVRPGAFYTGFHIVVNYTDNTSSTFNPAQGGNAMDWLIKPGCFRNYFIYL
jgi:hypothetical protein